MRASKAGIIASALVLTGCSLAPHYTPPQVATPEAYKELGPWQPAGADVPPAGKWWEAFGDETLNGLEERIEQGNYTLAAAAARYREAQAALRQARADRYPSITAGADVERAQASAGRPLGPGTLGRYTDGSVGASLAYEIDLFGRITNQIRANAANAQASEQDEAAVRLALQAQLATAYFELRGLDARTNLLNQTVEAFGRAYDLTHDRHEGGIASGVDVSRARTQLSSARAELSSIAISRAHAEHAIAVLVGEAPSTFTLPVGDLALKPPVIPAGLPSVLLQRRPDIVAAERRVAAANSLIGVAKAALFPNVTLGGEGGFESSSGALFSASNAFWALGPLRAALSVFDGGKRLAGVRIAHAQYDETAANYRQSVLSAFREVEDDLAAQRLLVAQARDQADAAAAAERTRDLALTRYHDGATDYLEVVTAQTAALDAERALLEVRTLQLTTAADTVRAVGGSF
jgi:multidrug efflux system outer membrane protein